MTGSKKKSWPFWQFKDDRKIGQENADLAKVK